MDSCAGSCFVIVQWWFSCDLLFSWPLPAVAAYNPYLLSCWDLIVFPQGEGILYSSLSFQLCNSMLQNHVDSTRKARKHFDFCLFSFWFPGTLHMVEACQQIGLEGHILKTRTIT